MLLYCLKCRQNTESKKIKFVKIKNGKIMLLSKFTVRDSIIYRNLSKCKKLEDY